MSTYYPVSLKVQGRRCVIVGGGEVAERKARALLAHGAQVEVISSVLSTGLGLLANEGSVAHLKREYKHGDLADAVLAIAATDDAAVNTQVAREGREKRVLVNIVDDPDTSDFIVPSLLTRGDLSIAICTSGRTPALSRKVRTELEGAFPPEYALLVDLVAEVRQELRRDGVVVDQERWQTSLDIGTLLGLIRDGRSQEARERLAADLVRG